ncbi:exostosin-like 3 [Sycon ciliatum]|uniref:exostosin-like 3 n=1 Tax=Sycon ciliatum TaxID=27933 RepID=UPI0020A847FD|eukprot:scpid25026/ scgid34181/ Exostosin-like 3; Glucuronyl-galactosyl-proteoglycan 4-alpha-N-acetylglucosaminyltransferase; Multiple exostosis-like protein 3
MSRRLCDRCSVRQMLTAVALVAFMVFLPAAFLMQTLISSSGTSRRRPGGGLDSSSNDPDRWRWGSDRVPDLEDGGETAVSTEEKKRYQDEVDELRVIAKSLRDEINAMHTSWQNHAGNVQIAAAGKGKMAERQARPKLSLRDAAAKAEAIPDGSDSEFDMRCPRPVDDFLMPLSPVNMKSQAPDAPKIMPRPESLAAYPVPKYGSSGGSRVRSCTVSSCMDLGRCSLSRPFSAFLYDETLPDGGEKSVAGEAVRRAHAGIRLGLAQSGYTAHSADDACILIVIVTTSDTGSDRSKLTRFLLSLKHWRGDGRNHLIIDAASGQLHKDDDGQLLDFDYGNAILSSMHRAFNQHRHSFDVFMPPLEPESVMSDGKAKDGKLYHYTLLPTYRPALLSFSAAEHSQGRDKAPGDGAILGHYVSSRDLSALKQRGGAEFVFQLDCVVAPGRGESRAGSLLPGYYLCGSRADQDKLVAQSTFTLVVEPLAASAIQLREFVSQLLACFRLGSVPVVLRTYVYMFPFEEVLDWAKAAVVLPAARVAEVNFVLQHVYEDDILAMRRQGHFLWTTYLSSASTITETVINIVRRRTGLPAKVLATVSLQTHHKSAIPSQYSPLPSPTFRQNFTYESLERWNKPPGAMFLPPMSPYVEHKPSGWEYIRRKGDARKLHPVVENGGALWGEAFQNYLAGTHEPERFTVVLLTYRRELVLYNALQRLVNLPRLDKVIVVWNDDQNGPSEEVSWPELQVPLEVVKVKRNSLNNRFLPLDNIQTAAVLSLDDDTQLRHEEIDFAFRAWRENRHRLVGFPGRFHSWDSRHGGWSYNANYSCELSMVLTGAAFVHKFYFHLYSHFMDERIREHVDKVMNCEDIAMNMLVSHLTQQPPIKVTLRWTFHCSGCTDALSDNTEHFNERHQCMNIFSDVYGYMPLIKTQTRIDSVLFKTRVPHNRGKCYTFV